MSGSPAPYEHLEVESAERDTLLHVTLNRPKGNVLTEAMMEELSGALETHRSNRHLRLVVLSGAGPHFSFGASVEEHRRDQAAQMLATFHRLIKQVAAFPVPVSALVSGNCLGGAFELVLACHLVFATPDARFGCPEIKLGVFPPVLAVLGGRRLGDAAAERLLLAGGTIDVSEADRLGFLTAVLDGPDAWDGLLAWYRENLGPLSAHALRTATRAARETSGMLADLEHALGAAEGLYVSEVLNSADGNEGIEAFLDKRLPEWRDE
ncbi:MAG: enoyl-CoA hydratase/isomerase family protein [Gemmatimonadota bacterium]